MADTGTFDYYRAGEPPRVLFAFVIEVEEVQLLQPPIILSQARAAAFRGRRY